MREVFWLASALIALMPGAARADGATLACPDDGVCVVVINVVMSGRDCTATGPRYVTVPRNFVRPTWLVFLLSGGDPTVEFDSDPIRFKAKGDQGSNWEKHFDRAAREHPRLVVVRDKNPNFTPAETFEYDFVVVNGGTKCTSADPFIHNTN